ncbi:MAG: hypothetical protein QXY45_00075 [Candidatus Aenigmatarchaeota archaeon]
MNRLERKLLLEKTRFTKFWVDYMLKNPNSKWSVEQKRFIDALFMNNRKNKLTD